MSLPSNAESVRESSPGAIQWWSLTADQTLRELSSDLNRGLSLDEVALRTSRYGRNELVEEPPTPFWRKLLAQFNELVIWILIGAAIMSGLLADWIDSAVIIAIVIANASISLFQEEKAGRALAALRKLSPPIVKVIRDGLPQTIPARDLVPGDRIELEAGDHVSADARLIKTYNLRVQEAALTGESAPVYKNADCVLDANTALAERGNVVYMGTAVATGKASAVAVATGMETELGHIAGLLQRQKIEPTPLQRRLTELGKVLVVVCLAIVTIIFVLHVVRGGDLLEVFLISVSLAVAAVPEGMPAVVTLTLALGLQRMIRRNALVRKLPCVETLGSVTVICSDKTGTLTRNEMTVREVVVADRRYQITGAGYTPQGRFVRCRHDAAEEAASGQMLPGLGQGDASGGETVNPSDDADLIQALTIAARCNNASLTISNGGANAWSVIGDPTEGALLVAALKAGIDLDAHKPHVLYEIPFDPDRKAMSVVVRAPSEAPLLYIKGAPEVILARSVGERVDRAVRPLTESRRRQIKNACSEMAARALRVLAVAYREHPGDRLSEDQECDLVFAGLFGLIDPPRQEAEAAIRKCFQAGIRPVMITGDHPATALAIARELHIAAAADQVISGPQLDALSDSDLTARAPQYSVFARVAAQHKLRIVRAWQQRGEVVAMTGDGVNDAPAVRAADIGIAMGIVGTDVTKEAADMVLTDDNFASIVSAVEEGRGIFDNIQKFVHYLLACNAGEVLLMFLASLAGWPAPLSAIQILWINLVTDGLPALALGMEPLDRGIMTRKPRPPREPLISWATAVRILLHGSMMAAVAMLGFWMVYQGNDSHLGRARIVAFCISAFSQIFFSLGCRSPRYTMPQLGLFSNPKLFGAIGISCLLQLAVVVLPFMHPVFDVPQQLSREWLLIIGLALAPVTVVELGKLLAAKFARLTAMRH